MITVFENEIELEFDNGKESGFINVSTSGCSEDIVEVVMNCGESFSEFSVHIDTTVDKEPLIAFLKQTVKMLEG